MKYVLFEDPSGIDRAIIFDEFTNHKDIVEWMPQYWKLKSAGRVSFGDNENVSCVNGSITLGQSFSTEQSDDDTMTLRLIEKTRV